MLIKFRSIAAICCTKNAVRRAIIAGIDNTGQLVRLLDNSPIKTNSQSVKLHTGQVTDWSPCRQRILKNHGITTLYLNTIPSLNRNRITIDSVLIL